VGFGGIVYGFILYLDYIRLLLFICGFAGFAHFVVILFRCNVVHWLSFMGLCGFDFVDLYYLWYLVMVLVFVFY